MRIFGILVVVVFWNFILATSQKMNAYAQQDETISIKIASKCGSQEACLETGIAINCTPHNKFNTLCKFRDKDSVKHLYILPSESPDSERVLLEFDEEQGTACEAQLSIGLLGFTKKGFPIVKTDRGETVLPLKGLVAGYPGARTIIDITSKEILASYLAPNDNAKVWGFGFDENAAEIAQLNMGGVCYLLRPEQNASRISYYPTHNCKGEHGDDYDFSDYGIEPASQEQIDLARAVLPKQTVDYFELSSERVKKIVNTDLIVVDLVEACT